MIWYGVPLWRNSLKAVARSEEAQRVAIVLGQEQRVLAVHIAGCIDGAALRWGFLDEAVGTEQAAGSEHSPGAAVGLEQQAGVVGSFAAVGGTEFGLPGCWMDGDDVDDAADGAGTIERSLAPPRTSSML